MRKLFAVLMGKLRKIVKRWIVVLSALIVLGGLVLYFFGIAFLWRVGVDVFFPVVLVTTGLNSLILALCVLIVMLERRISSLDKSNAALAGRVDKQTKKIWELEVKLARREGDGFQGTSS